MKTIVIAVFALLLAAPTAHAQGPTISPQKSAEVKQGRKMMLAGGLLAIGGLAVLPITASTSDQVSGAAKATSMAMVGAGAGLAWFGARKARRGSRPEMTFGATAGRTTGVFVRREW